MPSDDAAERNGSGHPVARSATRLKEEPDACLPRHGEGPAPLAVPRSPRGMLDGGRSHWLAGRSCRGLPEPR